MKTKKSPASINKEVKCEVAESVATAIKADNDEFKPIPSKPSNCEVDGLKIELVDSQQDEEKDKAEVSTKMEINEEVEEPKTASSRKRGRTAKTESNLTTPTKEDNSKPSPSKRAKPKESTPVSSPNKTISPTRRSPRVAARKH